MTAAKSKGKRRIQPKFGPLAVDGGDYSVRINPPLQTYADLMSGDFDRIIGALVVLVAEHPFVEDDDVTPLAVGHWPVDEVTKFVEAYGALMNALPPA